ncbi:MAG: hypothetical protein U0800_14230 [Isosphaeraceae bacterium]
MMLPSNRTFLATSALIVVLAANSQADLIPYPNPGHYNNATYSFVADHDGDVVGYFAGSDASYQNRVGLLVNGVLTSAGYGLDDHASSIGQAFNFGRVRAGDVLVFDLWVITLGSHVYSDPSMNAPFDSSGYSGGHNHLYATPYTATSPVFGSTPPGMYVAFEDQRFPNTDYSYADENFVFTNVIRSVPEPPALTLVAVGLAALLGVFLPRLRGRYAS